MHLKNHKVYFILLEKLVEYTFEEYSEFERTKAIKGA